MDGRFFAHESAKARKIGEKLYLDTSSADVTFLFPSESGESERVPAHKCILFASCERINSMLKRAFESSQDENSTRDEIVIDDVSAAAFREFLQYFYLGRVKLTANNTAEVIKLCQKYELQECLSTFTLAMKDSLSIDDMCWGWAIAKTLQEDNFIDFCEQKIEDNSLEILLSDSFLECTADQLEEILSMISFSCTALELINAYMRWVKAECARRKIYRRGQNLRTTLGDFYEKMPFAELTKEEFKEFSQTYKGFFKPDEVENIWRLIALNADPVRVLDCDRYLHGATIAMGNNGGDIFTAFTSNQRILLVELFAELHGTAKFDTEIPFDINAGCSEILASGKAPIAKGADQLHVILPQPISIEANKLHFINIYSWSENCINLSREFTIHPYRKCIELDDDVKITFRTNIQFNNDFISRIIFRTIPANKPEDGPEERPEDVPKARSKVKLEETTDVKRKVEEIAEQKRSEVCKMPARQTKYTKCATKTAAAKDIESATVINDTKGMKRTTETKFMKDLEPAIETEDSMKCTTDIHVKLQPAMDAAGRKPTINLGKNLMSELAIENIAENTLRHLEKTTHLNTEYITEYSTEEATDPATDTTEDEIDHISDLTNLRSINIQQNCSIRSI